MICSLVSAYAFHPTLAPRTPKIAHRSRTTVADLAAAKSALFAALDGAPDRGLAEYEDYQTPAWVSAVADAMMGAGRTELAQSDWAIIRRHVGKIFRKHRPAPPELLRPAAGRAAQANRGVPSRSPPVKMTANMWGPLKN